MCLLHVKVATANRDEPVLTSALFSGIGAILASESLQEICLRKRPGQAWMRSYLKALDRFDQKRSLMRSLQGEACSALWAVDTMTMQEIRKAGLFVEEFHTLFREDILHLLRRLRKDYAWVKNRFPAIPKAPAGKGENALPLLSSKLLPSIRLAYVSFVEAEARLRAVRIALAAIAYEARHGKPLNRLADLAPDFIGSVPEDPFTGRAFAFRNGRLYSFGRSGRDDGGILEEPDKDDIGFRRR